MSATWTASTQPALFAGQSCAKRMSFSMHTTCMTTPASTTLIETGVLASVSLLVVVLSVSLLVSLVLIGLTLSGLTGLLMSLVGLVTEVDISKKQGD